MQRILTGLLAVALMTNAEAATLEPGATAPAFDLPGGTGQVRLADLRGQVVYVDFWASWCAPCKQSFPWMNALQAKYGARGLRIVAINVDSKTEDARRFLKSVPANFSIAFDPAGSTPRAYGIKGMPSSYLIDAKGKILFSHIGFQLPEQDALEQKIAAALQVNGA
jgi:cytochrome c biogenesis protein CcmG/thiol:disulfide interchange protein DsbE